MVGWEEKGAGFAWADGLYILSRHIIRDFYIFEGGQLGGDVWGCTMPGAGTHRQTDRDI